VDGGRQITVDRPDHSRIFAPSHGVPYVQHPYVYRGQSYSQRTFYLQGKTLPVLYRPYRHGSIQLDVYAPSRFYDQRMYQWVTTRTAPTPFTWSYVTNRPPWFGYYRSSFTPDASYTSPTSWLADFVIGASLAAVYVTKPPTSQAPPADAAPVTPQIKQKVADEVDRQVKQESAEAQANAQNRSLPPGAGSVVEELGDGRQHTFVAVSDLDLVDGSGRRCMLTEADVVEVVSAPKVDTGTADVVVLWSKGGVECQPSSQVQIALTDLQEMQNHMRATIDQAMASTKAGRSATSVPASYASAAPPPDPNAGQEIDQQKQLAAAVEG